jgi:hypothetical protein
MQHKIEIWFGINIHKKNVDEDNVERIYFFKSKKESNAFLMGVKECFGYTDLKIKTETVDVLEHVKPNKDCELCDTYDSGYTCIACEGDQVKEKYPNAYTNDEGIWEVREEIKI